MNDHSDPLESELAALQPRPISPQLHRRVAERLAEPSLGRHRGRRLLLMAGGLAAAFSLGFYLWPAPRPAVQPASSHPQPLALSLPHTILEYRRALALSPEALEALLDRESVADTNAASEAVPLTALSRIDTSSHGIFGDD